MDTTRSFLPSQQITRNQAIVVYREAVKVLREHYAAKGEDFGKGEFDTYLAEEVEYQAGQAGPFAHNPIGRWVTYLLQEVHTVLTVRKREMSQHCEEWGCFLSGGHLYTDASEAVAQCKRIATLAGLKYKAATITRYATGNSV